MFRKKLKNTIFLSGDKNKEFMNNILDEEIENRIAHKLNAVKTYEEWKQIVFSHKGFLLNSPNRLYSDITICAEKIIKDRNFSPSSTTSDLFDENLKEAKWSDSSLIYIVAKILNDLNIFVEFKITEKTV